ncbi:hypothetical protein HY227_01395 [Candidatus Wolfebacteria bacterium]|nr:hypothetical protein [Candidatus Wolfebacteria bacterium]
MKMKVIIEKTERPECPFRIYTLAGAPLANSPIARMNVAPPKEADTIEEALRIARELLEKSQENTSSKAKEI